MGCAYKTTVFSVLFSFLVSLSAICVDSWAWDKSKDQTYGVVVRYDNKGRLYHGHKYYSDICGSDPICQARATAGKWTLALSMIALIVSFVLLVLVQLVRSHKLKEVKWYIMFFGLLVVSFFEGSAYIAWSTSQPNSFHTGASSKATALNCIVILTLLGFASKSQLMAPT